MEPYVIGLILDTILLLILGVIDFVRGESRLDTAIIVYLAGLLLYPILPLTFMGKVLLFVFHLVLLGIILGLYWFEGGIGLMDIVIASHVPLIFPAIYIMTITPGLLLLLLGLFLHSYRARRYVCQRGLPIPGTNVGVRGWLAWDKWYFIPNKIKNPEKEDEEIKKIKETWKSRKRCESARFAFPMVWSYALFHTGVIFSLLLFVYLNIHLM
jgi:hypothetical protein